jgi:hypothetical protein
VYIASGAGRWDWLGNSLVVVSDAGGIPSLERLQVDGGRGRLTLALGAAAAPDVSRSDGGIWYLDLHAKGLDVRHQGPAARTMAENPTLPHSFAPVAPHPREPAALFDSALVDVRGYGFGPRRSRYVPGVGFGADGGYGVLAIANYDPVTRLGVLAQGAVGQRATWRGASLGTAWRGWSAATLNLTGFVSAPGALGGVPSPRFDGAALSLERTLDFGASAWSWHLGGSRARVRSSDTLAFDRTQALAQVRYLARASHGLLRSVQVGAQGSLGESDGAHVTRGVFSLGIVAALGDLRFQAAATAGRVRVSADSGAAVAFERFSLGGLPAPLFDAALLPQQLAEPALRSETSTGNAFARYRAAIGSAGVPGELYAAWFKVYDPNGTWQRVLGGESERRFPAFGFVSLPRVSLSYGVAYSLDHPRRRRWTFYGGARFAP